MAPFNYKFDKYDFKKFLLDSDEQRFRNDEYIFWVGRIPLPDELVFKIFDDRSVFLKLYLDHLFSILILMSLEKNNSKISAIDTFPNADEGIVISNLQITNDIKKNMILYGKLRDRLCSLLLIESYELTSENILEALKHKGKKYNRFYIHSALCEEIKNIFEWFRYSDFKAQSDMFGNVVADQYRIYRSGFSDALSGIFNKLIDFIVSGSLVNEGLPVQLIDNSISIKFIPVESRDKAFHQCQQIYDGSAWEPIFINNQIGFNIDTAHPFGKRVVDSDDEVTLQILKFLSTKEFEATSDKDKKVYEILRKDLSRAMKHIFQTPS